MSEWWWRDFLFSGLLLRWRNTISPSHGSTASKDLTLLRIEHLFNSYNADNVITYCIYKGIPIGAKNDSNQLPK